MPHRGHAYPVLNDSMGFRRRLGRWWGERTGQYAEIGGRCIRDSLTNARIKGGWLQVYQKHKQEIWTYFNDKEDALGAQNHTGAV